MIPNNEQSLQEVITGMVGGLCEALGIPANSLSENDLILPLLEDNLPDEEIIRRIMLLSFKSTADFFLSQIVPLSDQGRQDFRKELHQIISEACAQNENATKNLVGGFLSGTPDFQYPLPPSLQYFINRAKPEIEESFAISVISLDPTPEDFGKALGRGISELAQAFPRRLEEEFEKLTLELSLAELDFEFLINKIKDYYERFKTVAGLFLGLLDIIDNQLEPNLESYFHDSHYFGRGLYYPPREIWLSGKLRPAKDKVCLRDYLARGEYPNIQQFFTWIAKDVNGIRNHAAHRVLDTAQKDLHELNYDFPELHHIYSYNDLLEILLSLHYADWYLRIALIWRFFGQELVSGMIQDSLLQNTS